MLDTTHQDPRSTSQHPADPDTTVADSVVATPPEHARWTELPGLAARFEPVRSLGVGGMGEVYLAHDVWLRRPVAIKRVVAPDQATRSRVEREVRLTADIKHPNVVTVHDVHVSGDNIYIVYEYIEGTTLANMVTPMPWYEVLGLAVGLARGLAAMHERGVLHRDIKPGNAILERASEQVKLIDLGVAKRVPAEPGASANARTGPGQVVTRPSPARRAPDTSTSTTPGAITPDGGRPGTPRYLAPEVWDGKEATRRSDVYALGVLLHQLCTGEWPPVMMNPDTRRPLALADDTIDSRFAFILRRCVALDPEARYESGCELLRALEALHATLDCFDNPYRGLAPFRHEHRELFFGRDSDIRKVIERWNGTSCVLLVGDSGIGKTSLALAGILPRVEERGLDGTGPWQSAHVVPGKQPVAAIATALARACRQRAAELVAHAREEKFAAVLAALRRGHDRAGEHGGGLVLFVDQLEELVTLSEPAEAAIAARFLAYMVEHGGGGLRVLGAARGDRLTDLAELPGLGALLDGHIIYVVTSLQRDAIRAAIVNPAHKTAVRFESDATVDELVRATLDARGGLPLLQFALAELWDARDPASRLIPARALDDIGGMSGALARHADAVLRALADPARRAVARRIVIRLVTLHETRARCTQSELAKNDAMQQAVLAHLVAQRLLVCHEVDHDAGGEWVYSIAHDALVTAWPTLRDWLDRERVRRHVLARLVTASREWEELGRPRDLLLHGRRLDEASQLEPDDLAPIEDEFLRASQKQQRLARWRRRAIVVAAIAMVLAVYTGLRIGASRRLATTVDEHVVLATQALQQARAAKNAFFAAHAKAMAALRADHTKAWQAPWQDALGEVPALTTHYRKASQELDAAMTLDATRGDVRALLATVLDERILIAITLGRQWEADELLARLDVVDVLRSRAWREPVQVEITTEPGDARVTILRYNSVPVDHLWTDPIADLSPAQRVIDLVPGSYVLQVSASDGRVEVRYPLLVRSRQMIGNKLAVTIPRPRRDDVPDGYVYIPPGTFFYGHGRAPEDEPTRDWHETVPLHARVQPGFLMARHETIVADWLAFLEDCADDICWASKADGRAIDVRADDRHLEISRRAGKGWEIRWQPDPGQPEYRAGAGEMFVYTGRHKKREADWLRLPISGISARQAKAYVAWLDRVARVPGARLCSEEEWERAARGADDHLFPHGNGLLPGDANFDQTYGRQPAAYGPDEVGAHPRSVSPFGIEDMAGNIAELTRAAFGDDDIVARGGAFHYAMKDAMVFNRWPGLTTGQWPYVGLRVCAPAPAE